MPAMKNAAHMVVLGIWAVLGILFSLQTVFGAGALMPALSYWLWFGGFVAVTTLVTSSFASPLAALAVHAGAFMLLYAIPRSMPFGLLRLGIDLLSGRGMPFFS